MAVAGPSKRNLDQIKAALLLQPALTSHYECSFTIPNVENVEKKSALSFIKDNFKSTGDKIPGTSEFTNLITLSCSDASLPGSTLATHELNNDVTGVTQRHAYRRLYDDRADFTFYVNQNYTQIRLFEAWMRFISGEQITGAANLYKPYRVQYPVYYKTSIYISKFERNLQTLSASNTMVYSFFNAFPVSVGSMPVSYESSQLLKVTVSFTYDRYIAGNTFIIPAVPQQSQPTTPGVANNTPTPPTPAQQSTTNTTTLGNISAGTLTNTNTNFDSSAVTPNTGIPLF